MMIRRIMLVMALSLCVLSTASAQNKRDDQVKKDKQGLAGDQTWIYNDLDQAFAAAKTTNKPLMVVFR